MAHFYSILRFGLYRPRMHAYDGLKRSLPHPSSEGTGDVRVDCDLRAEHAGRASARPRAAPCLPAPVGHHDPRRGSACRAAPRDVRCHTAAVAAIICTRAASTSSTVIDDNALPCQSMQSESSASQIYLSGQAVLDGDLIATWKSVFLFVAFGRPSR